MTARCETPPPPTAEELATGARVRREKEVKNAWRNWKKSKRERRIIARLPAANPAPKSIIVTRNRVPDGSGGSIPAFHHHGKSH